jgi:hypothetical protein
MVSFLLLEISILIPYEIEIFYSLLLYKMKKLLLGTMMTVGLLVSGGVSLANDYTPCDVVTDIPRVECEALVDFYYSTNGDGWTKGFSGDIPSNKPWLTGNQACNWRGLTCNASPKYVTAIRLSNHNLSGNLNSSLFALSGLTSLDVSVNNLEGILPESY